MPEMRTRAVSEAVAVVLAVGAVLSIAGCVPRPASLGSPSSGPAPTPLASFAPGASDPEGPVGPTPMQSFSRPTPLPEPTFLAYTVKAGDTLTSIAREFHTTPRSVAFWSRGEHPSLDPESAAYEPNRLEIGWVLLVIPGAVFDENELLDATPSPAPGAAAGTSSGPTAGATAS